MPVILVIMMLSGRGSCCDAPRANCDGSVAAVSVEASVANLGGEFYGCSRASKVCAVEGSGYCCASLTRRTCPREGGGREFGVRAGRLDSRLRGNDVSSPREKCC